MRQHLSIIAAVVLGALALADGAAAQGTTAPCATGHALAYKNRAWNQGSTVSYSINRLSIPPRNLVEAPSEQIRRRDRVVARIRDGARTWNSGKNECHYRALHGFKTAYAGDTTSTGANHLDGHNVIDFTDNLVCGSTSGPLLHACVSGRVSGNTVDHSSRTQSLMVEFDMRFQRTAHVYYDGVGVPPSGRIDVWALAAHEWGHVVGLADLYGADDKFLTMYGYLATTEIFPRTLGRSDYLGLSRLYGP